MSTTKLPSNKTIVIGAQGSSCGTSVCNYLQRDDAGPDRKERNSLNLDGPSVPAGVSYVVNPMFSWFVSVIMTRIFFIYCNSVVGVSLMLVLFCFSGYATCSTTKMCIRWQIYLHLRVERFRTIYGFK